MRHYNRARVSHFGHLPTGRRAVSMKGPLGDLVDSSSAVMTKEMVARLREAGEIIMEGCKAAAHFSKRIPPSLHVKADYHSVYIEGGGPAAPNAYPFDPPSRPPVYHPVWGRGPREKWHWAPQPYRPFLEIGERLRGAKATERFANIIDDWAKVIGRNRP